MRMTAFLTFLILLTGSTWCWCQDGDLDAREIEDAKFQRLLRERKQLMQRDEALSREPTSLDGGASVNEALLSAVVDNSFGIRPEERDIYFRLLELAIRTPLVQQERFVAQLENKRRLQHEEIARKYEGVKLDDLPTPEERNRVRLARAVRQKLLQNSSEFPTFHDIVLYPEQSRGRPVSIHGVMRKLTKFDPGKNDRGIGEVYEAWIYPDDSPSIPAVVVFIDKPEHLKVGGDLTEEVQVTGYFLKMYAYQGQEKTTRAPLILAGGLLWKQRQEPYRAAAVPMEIYLLITVITVLAGYSFWRSQRREMTSHIHPRIEADFHGFPPKELSVHHPMSEDVHTDVEPNDS